MPSDLRPIPLMCLATWVLCVVLPLGAQQSPAQRQFDKLTEKIVKNVAKTDAISILTTPLSGCLGQPQLCADFDALLRTSLERQIPGVKFIDRDDAVKHLGDYGFLSIDAYAGALDNVAQNVGAQVVIDETFQRNRNNCNMKATVADAKHHYELGEFSTDIPCIVATKTRLSLVKDAASGVFLIVPLPETSDPSPVDSHIGYPQCVSCPDPHYTGDARSRGIQGSVRILLTVTNQGNVENPKVLGAVEDGLAMASIRAVSGWKMKPAEGPDGQAFPARVSVEITFRLLN